MSVPIDTGSGNGRFWISSQKSRNSINNYEHDCIDSLYNIDNKFNFSHLSLSNGQKRNE